MSNGNADSATTKPIMASEATLRDLFAAKAMRGLITRMIAGEDSVEAVSMAAYKLADAMLAEHEKGSDG